MFKIVLRESAPEGTALLLPEPPPEIETMAQYLEWLRANPKRVCILHGATGKATP